MKLPVIYCPTTATLLAMILTSSSALAGSPDNAPRTSPSPSSSLLPLHKVKSHSKNKKHDLLEERINVSAAHYSAGGGMMINHNTGRTISTITSDYIDQQSSLTSIADLVSVMPGVVAAGDGTGTTTFQQFSMRGMGTSEIGFLLEGMPASNAFTYSAYSNSLLDNQNIGSISAMQGSVDINAAVYNATGGQIALTLKKPTKKKKITFSASGGSFNAHKEFMRIDSGEIGRSGVRTFISASHQSADLWRGFGGTERYHVDAALTKQWSYKSETEILFGWNQSDSVRIYYPTLDQWNSLGTKYGTTNDPTRIDYYKYSTKQTNSIYGTIKNHFDFGHGLSLDAQAYSILFSGPYTYGRQLTLKNSYYSGTHLFPSNTFLNQVPNAVNGKAITIANETWSTQNSGLNLTGTWKYKFNTLKLGYWYSYAVADDQESLYPVTSTGQMLSTPLQANGFILQDINNNTLQQLNQLSLDDKMTFFHRKLTIDTGIRLAMVNRQSTVNLPMDATVPYPRKKTNNVFVPAPQMLITYKFNDTHQLYVNATTGYHLPTGTGAQVPGFGTAKSTPITTPINGFKPEYMINEEVGYRYTGPVMLNVAGFHYSVTNNQVSTSVQQPGCTNANMSDCLATQITNAGNLEAYGAQFEFATKPWHHFSGYFTGSYLRTRLGDNIPTTGLLNKKTVNDFLPTIGKEKISSPQFMGTASLQYDDGTTFGRFNVHYVGKQYASLMNDASIPAYIVTDLNLGYHLPKVWHIASRAALHLTNLGNNHYFSYVYGAQNTLNDVKGIKGSVISGSGAKNLTYSIAQGFAITASLSGTFD